MSAKLVVQKYETDVNFKYLNVTIEDDDQTRFGDWLEGETQNSKKANSKSSHLVVKIVSGQEYGHFNLDSCAKVVEGLKINNFEELPFSESNSFLSTNRDESSFVDTSDNNTFKPLHNIYNYRDIGHRDSSQNIQPQSPPLQKGIVDNARMTNSQVANANKNVYEDLYMYSSNEQNAVSPLEYSLERVKENNARIMENIHMLNRTLNYTKKKENLDIVCPKTIRSYPCNTCGKCFVYETGLRRHYSTRHSIMDVQPRWQVVWTCIECFQVWPHQNVAIQHATQCCQSNNMDCVREIKTSSLLQCEFCEKVFTSIPRLLRHAKTHTTANNYECNACEMAFLSYKTAEQHWLLCPWLKSCYTFYLPKLLLCNACDRKFRHYEQLYAHR